MSDDAANDKEKETVRSWFKRNWLTVLGIASGWVIAIPVVVDWVTPDEPELAARIITRRVEYPPQVIEALPEGINTDIGEKTDLKDLTGYLGVTIKNDGIFTADNVRLEVGDSGIYTIKWRTGESERGHFQHWIDIGTINDGAEAQIQAWVTSEAGLKDSYKLRRKDGVQEVEAVWENTEHRRRKDLLYVLSHSLLTFTAILIVAVYSRRSMARLYVDATRRSALIARQRYEIKLLRRRIGLPEEDEGK